MTPELVIKRTRPIRPVISLVPMVDVMLILLVFFMVTSTYLNLDMIPADQHQDQAASQTTDSPTETILIRLAADGTMVMNGASQSAASLYARLADKLATSPRLQVLLLPSGRSNMQALISAMDTITNAGVTRMRVVRLEARP